MITISQVSSGAQATAVRDLSYEYLTWWAETEPEDFAQTASFQELRKKISTLPGSYIPLTGRLLLALKHGQPAGCITLNFMECKITL